MTPLLLHWSYHATGMTTDGIAVKGLNLKLPLLNQEKHCDYVRCGRRTEAQFRTFFYIYIYIYIGFKTFFYVVRHLDSIASYLPTGRHLGFFRSGPSLYRPSSFYSVFLVLSFVSASTAMLFWVIFFLPFSEHGRTM